ncbi:hypothetical protein FXV83_19925 [Bradyrhizobium hipponense]|uniref:Uncharacterized protein n=2 Tax=Bradyrhizobium hipponense TaxID=2605638 RepID=A0A5S4YLT3_9BRAD|nr:hypothetical protein FXV83_19925 [Bradyrhizobium hipponense]
MTHHHPGTAMAKTAKPSKPPKKADDKAKKPSPPRDDTDHDYEDGDIATPKRDRYGPDDEPL